MNAQTPAFTALRPSQIVDEYNRKAEALGSALGEFNAAGSALKMAASIGGTWGNVNIDIGRIWESTLEKALLSSAWRHLYDVLQIDRLASAKDKRLFEQSMAKPAPFTMDNIRATFGQYIADPRGSILRGLAEAFCDLDPAFKSHEKMKIGVKGLPKRVIVSGFGRYSSGWGWDKTRDILNALAAYQGKPLITHMEMTLLCEKGDGNSLRDGGTFTDPFASHHEIKNGTAKTVDVIERGVWLKRFANGNGHLFFTPETLRDVNMALAEFYGDVLADCEEEKPAGRRASTAVSKDLQYYPTPKPVIERMIGDAWGVKGKRVLEPSCGCGRILDALRAEGAECIGIEIDPNRAEISRAKGHNVMRANFLDTVPTEDYDAVFMNPPFYGKHYAKHVAHALKFLKPGGQLVAILPITARYDHGLVDGQWCDLPIGSFAESGTNINTSILTIRKPE